METLSERAKNLSIPKVSYETNQTIDCPSGHQPEIPFSWRVVYVNRIFADPSPAQVRGRSKISTYQNFKGRKSSSLMNLYGKTSAHSLIGLVQGTLYHDYFNTCLELLFIVGHAIYLIIAKRCHFNQIFAIQFIWFRLTLLRPVFCVATFSIKFIFLILGLILVLVICSLLGLRCPAWSSPSFVNFPFWERYIHFVRVSFYITRWHFWLLVPLCSCLVFNQSRLLCDFLTRAGIFSIFVA